VSYVSKPDEFLERRTACAVRRGRERVVWVAGSPILIGRSDTEPTKRTKGVAARGELGQYASSVMLHDP